MSACVFAVTWLSRRQTQTGRVRHNDVRFSREGAAPSYFLLRRTDVLRRAFVGCKRLLGRIPTAAAYSVSGAMSAPLGQDTVPPSRKKRRK
jgi:hypothetical protein